MSTEDVLLEIRLEADRPRFWVDPLGMKLTEREIKVRMAARLLREIEQLDILALRTSSWGQGLPSPSGETRSAPRPFEGAS